MLNMLVPLIAAVETTAEPDEPSVALGIVLLIIIYLVIGFGNLVYVYCEYWGGGDVPGPLGIAIVVLLAPILIPFEIAGRARDKKNKELYARQRVLRAKSERNRLIDELSDVMGEDDY